PDGNNTPIPLTGLSVSKTIMVANAKAAKGEVSQAPALVAKSADGKAARSARRPTTAQRRAVADARKATIKRARDYIAQLMEQPAMRAIRERGIVGSNEWAVDG